MRYSLAKRPRPNDVPPRQGLDALRRKTQPPVPRPAIAGPCRRLVRETVPGVPCLPDRLTPDAASGRRDGPVCVVLPPGLRFPFPTQTLRGGLPRVKVGVPPRRAVATVLSPARVPEKVGIRRSVTPLRLHSLAVTPIRLGIRRRPSVVTPMLRLNMRRRS